MFKKDKPCCKSVKKDAEGADKFPETQKMCSLLKDIKNLSDSIKSLKNTNNFSPWDVHCSERRRQKVEFSKNDLEHMSLTKEELFELISYHLVQKRDNIENQLIKMGGK